MTLFLIFITFSICLLLNIPIVFCMALGALAGTIFEGQALGLILIPQRLVHGMDSFVLLAIPLFILAGSLMDVGGITKRLVRLARALVGHFKGSLGQIVVVSEMFFSGISGSTVADVSAISSMMIPPMRIAGYVTAYSVAIISATSAMGILIPPCNLMVVLGDITGVSVGALFFAGFVPAFILALILMSVLYYQAHKFDLPAGDRASFKELRSAMVGSLIPLGMPVIIFGGILGGICTPTEAAALAVVYAFIVGVFVYKEIKLHHFWKIVVDSGVTTGMVMFLVGMASIFSFQLAVQHVPEMLANLVSSITKNPYVFLVLSNIIFIVFGAILEGIPAAVIFVPMFMPIVTNMGIDPLHFGILVVASIGIGVFVPPVGVGLIIACGIAQVEIKETIRYLLPLLSILFIGLIFLTFFPWFTTFVPRLFNL